MSYDAADCEPCDVHTHRMIRARKDHRCAACRETIRRGDLYSYTFFLCDGDAYSVKRCARCEIIFRALVVKGAGDMFPAEKLDCGETWQDHWEEEPPEEIARLAFITPDEAQRQLQPTPGGTGEGS